MSDRIEWFTVTVPPGTAIASPLVASCVFQQGDVVEVDVIVPRGPAGLLGFFIGAGGSQYIPRTAGSFIVPDGIYFTWPLRNAINSGSWSVTAYNLDIFPHTLQVGFQINELSQSVSDASGGTGASSAILASAALAVPAGIPGGADPLSPDFLLSTLPTDGTVAA